MNESVTHYVKSFQSVSGQLPGQAVDWIVGQRRDAITKFEQIGFPTQKDEDWKYTELRSITRETFTPYVTELTDDCLSTLLVENLSSHRLVFINGQFSVEYSNLETLPDSIVVESLAEVMLKAPERLEGRLGKNLPDTPHGFTALNEALNNDGVVVDVMKSTTEKMSEPLELLYITTGENVMVNPRNLVTLHSDSQLQLIERHVSIGEHKSLVNSASEINVGENAQCDYYLIQTSSQKSSHISGTWVRQQTGSRFSARTISFGGNLVRNDLKVDLNGEYAHCDMYGLFNLSGKQHVDNHTTVVHAVPNCTSNELYKGVLDKRSRGVFHGRIKVELDAQKTDANQRNNNLLLSRDAEIDTKPQLEIYADDVKCSHGATVGQLDETSLFYLQSRGIEEKEARSLLTFAFANEVLNHVDITALKENLENRLSENLVRERV